MNAAWQESFARALLDPAQPCPPQLRGPGGAGAERRFAVHRNNVLVSLVDALAQSFPVAQALVGEPFFRAMAAAFVRAQPPRSPVLHQYGAAFPDFIAGFGPAGALRYLPDLARLEWARIEAAHAADAVPCRNVAAWDPARAGELLLRLHPAVRRVRSPYAVVTLWAAHQGEGEPSPVAVDRPEQAIVVRPELDVLVLACDAGTAAFVESLAQGRDLQASAACAARQPGFDLAACLRLLFARGAIASIEGTA